MTSRYVGGRKYFPTDIGIWNLYLMLQQARLACTTAWIASPTETVQLLDELALHTENRRI